MARLTGFTLGELRGKMGGLVFSRNKAGAYIRALVTPVNPQTVRQQTARYRFGNASILFQNLSAAAKDCWEVFARTHFNPLKGNSTGIYSGGNAFVALRQSTGQGNQYPADVSGVSGVIPLTFEFGQYELVTEPPATPTSSTIVGSDGIAYPINLLINSVKANGEIVFNLEFEGVPIVAPPTFNEFVNAEGQKFGIGFYFSNNLKFMGAKPNTALKLQVADTNVLNKIGTGVSVVPIDMLEGPQITLTNFPNPADIRDFPCVDDVILVTPFIRSEKGAIKLMTPSYRTVTT